MKRKSLYPSISQGIITSFAASFLFPIFPGLVVFLPQSRNKVLVSVAKLPIILDTTKFHFIFLILDHEKDVKYKNLENIGKQTQIARIVRIR